jgi:nitroreductase
MSAITSVPIHSILAERKSPRSLDESVILSSDEITALLEAARWAPSANNLQPWRFFVGQRGDAIFTNILESLRPFNQNWSKRASLLVLVAGVTKNEDGSDNNSYSYDCALAVSQLTIEAHSRGYVAHQMAGFEKDLAIQNLSIDTGLAPVVVIAIGKQAGIEQLDEATAQRELAPRVRKPLVEIVLRGLPN